MDAAVKPNASSVDPHRDARAIVRLVQCSQCSLPLRTPLTLPCGNSLCRVCLPELRARPGVTYPMTANRQEGFTCPFKECGRVHSLGDCSQDVTLAKVMDRVSIEVAHARPLTSDKRTLLDERPRWRNVVDSSKELRYPASRVLSGGRLVATYTMAEIGELKYDSEVAYQTMSPTGDDYEDLDIEMLAHLKESTKTEMDCQVCYALMLDPLTTTCGHTFCRKCVARVLDHSTMCPICRRDLPMPPGVRNVPGNKRLSNLLNGLCPDLVAARVEAAAQEEVPMLGEENVPLFVCTLAYPSMPTFLHIFEPRYRLMVRRAIESGDGKFGMLMYNRRSTPQGALGSVQFLQYGTLVHINSIEIMPDGRSLIEIRGVSRFRVKDWDMLDGYIVGNIERLNDISLAEEEQVETTETTGSTPAQHDLISQIDSMSTQELLRIGTDFIGRMRAASAPWLHEGVIASYGPPPDDAALFPYWFASILPIAEEEKYKLIPTTSVRERLKITARWVRRIEAQRW
ncbi:PUA-like domain-containing protein [Usnea florida]